MTKVGIQLYAPDWKSVSKSFDDFWLVCFYFVASLHVFTRLTPAFLFWSLPPFVIALVPFNPGCLKHKLFGSFVVNAFGFDVVGFKIVGPYVESDVC